MRAELVARLERIRVALVDDAAGFLAGELNDGAGLRALGAGPPEWSEVLRRYDGGRMGVVELWRVDELDSEQRVLASLPVPWSEGLAIGSVDGEPLVIHAETQQVAWFREERPKGLPAGVGTSEVEGDYPVCIELGDVEHLFQFWLLGEGYAVLADDEDDAWAALLARVG